MNCPQKKAECGECFSARGGGVWNLETLPGNMICFLYHDSTNRIPFVELWNGKEGMGFFFAITLKEFRRVIENALDVKLYFC